MTTNSELIRGFFKARKGRLHTSLHVFQDISPKIGQIPMQNKGCLNVSSRFLQQSVAKSISFSLNPSCIIIRLNFGDVAIDIKLKNEGKKKSENVDQCYI